MQFHKNRKVKKTAQRTKEIRIKVQNNIKETQEDTIDILTNLIGHDQVRVQIIKLLNRGQLVMHGLRSHDPLLSCMGHQVVAKPTLPKV